MSWKSVKVYDLNPEQRAKELSKKFNDKSIDVQNLLIKKLNNHGIKSEYENEVLKQLKK